jgi:hypothetical protein
MSASSIRLKVQRDGIIGGNEAQSELFSGLRTVCETPARVNADELAQFAAISWKDGGVLLSGQVRNGVCVR